MIRVCAALADSELTRQLRGKIPKESGTLPITAVAAKYPPTLLKALSKGPNDGGMTGYTRLGVLTEHLLRLPPSAIDAAALAHTSNTLFGVSMPATTLAAKTTLRYVTSLKATAEKLSVLMGEERSDVRFEPTLTLPACRIEGHPDIFTPTQIFEVKTTGQLAKNWKKFLLQLFSYAALCPKATRVHIVLPLQETVWSWDVSASGWPTKSRKLFAEQLSKYKNCEKGDDAKPLEEDPMFQPLLMTSFPIGYHVKKEKSLRATLQNLPSYDRPYQIFFTNKSAHFTVSDSDLTQSAEFVSAFSAQLYVHTPYILNLSGVQPRQAPDDEHNYVVACLIKHLQTAAAAGLKGVIVHVGKAVKLALPEALDNMRRNLLHALEAASPECPLLLETPAGQGTETLTTLAEFMDFARGISVDHPGFGVCVDTCHVFATGSMPHEYVKAVLDNPEWRPILKLIHFNDSKTPRGSRVDRHATLGTGHIPKQQLLDTAALATRHGIPMIIE